MDTRLDTLEPGAYESHELLKLAVDDTQNDQIGCDKDGWPGYTPETPTAAKTSPPNTSMEKASSVVNLSQNPKSTMNAA